jgi:selenocysteine lyase/cysteine desulfurase
LVPTHLYLDTARLGRMTPRAQQAHLDFARLAGAEGGSLFFERFLQFGADHWPAAAQRTYPGLSDWRGVPALKSSLRVLAGSDPELPVLLAARSAQLMRLAARLLVRTCENVLVTDLGWPPYHDILEAAARWAGRAITVASIRDAVFQGRASEEEVLRRVIDCAIQQGCDGLFLTAVSHLGVRLPVERIVRAVEACRPLRFAVIDGAQEFCHVSADLRNEYCDLYLAGCHKWLGACHPMGLGFYGRRRSRGVIETTLEKLLSSGEIDDPLLCFSSQLEGEHLDGRTETVNLAPLFAGQGAVADALEAETTPAGRLPQRLANLAGVAGMSAAAGWQSRLVPRELQSGILLLQAEREKRREDSPEALRQSFSDQGIAVTGYEDGLVRLSMPEPPWRPEELAHLEHALQATA